jgi:predicted transcriptional regulator
MNDKILESFREILGNYLTDIVKEKNLNLYNLEKLSGSPGQQIKTVLTGDKNYTIDTLCKVLHALDLYMFFAPKDGKHLDFEDMMKKMRENDPGL